MAAEADCLIRLRRSAGAAGGWMAGHPRAFAFGPACGELGQIWSSACPRGQTTAHPRSRADGAEVDRFRCGALPRVRRTRSAAPPAVSPSPEFPPHLWEIQGRSGRERVMSGRWACRQVRHLSFRDVSVIRRAALAGSCSVSWWSPPPCVSVWPARRALRPARSPFATILRRRARAAHRRARASACCMVLLLSGPFSQLSAVWPWYMSARPAASSISLVGGAPSSVSKMVPVRTSR